MMPRWAGRALLCGALISGTACAERDVARTDAASEAPVHGGTAVVAGPTDLDHANSLVAANRYTQELLRYALFLPLVHYDPELEYEPALATTWDLLGDTGVVFHLRRDVRWHDGRPSTARDVAFTFTRAKDPATAFPNAEYFARWTEVVLVDSFTVRFHFQPHAEPLAGLPFMPIMPEHLLDSVPAAAMARAAFNRQPVGNGRFRFVEYRPNDRWVFEANPDFPAGLGGRPYIDRLIWRVIPDNTAQAVELRTGRADLLLAPPPDEFAALGEEPRARAIVRTSRQYGFIGWNGTRPPFGDPHVRRALTMAIDRGRIIDALRAGQGEIATGPIAPYHWAYHEQLSPLPHSPDSAQTLLRSAGIDTFSFELKLPAASPINANIAQLIQADLAAVGVRVRLRPTEYGVIVSDITSPARNFDAVLLAWESDFRLNLRDLFHSEARGGVYQFASYSNAEIDRILDETALADRAAAKPLLYRLQEIMREEQPWSFLFYHPDLYMVSDRLRGVEMDVRGAFVSVAGWWIPQDRQTRSSPAPSRSDSTDHSPTPEAGPAR